ncbi:MAG TPA: cobalt ECF transporter T component CbiQ [Roseiflexaceae bacterium]|nr:cobalt ECF transporter T component CbiQ [Roseiflexaceae bacterium]
MHALSIDRFQSGTSLIHRLDPRVKVVMTVLFIVSTVILPDGAWPAFGLAWLATVLTSVLARLGPAYALKRSFIALPFALAAVSIMFTWPGRPLASFQLGSWALTVSDAGLVRFVSIVVRSWISVQIAILLTATTRFPDLMHALRHLRLPGLLVAIISFMYRYLVVLSEETFRLLRAREARSAGLEGKRMGGSLGWRARVAGNMAGQLFLRSYERSDRIYSAMQARGFNGEFLTMNPHVMRAFDWTSSAIALATIALVQLVGRL